MAVGCQQPPDPGPKPAPKASSKTTAQELDNVAPSPPGPPCELGDKSGSSPRPNLLGSLNDPVAEHVLQQRSCPTTFTEALTKLGHTDAEGCTDERFGPVQTILISEQAQLRETIEGEREKCTPKPVPGFRGVIRRACGGRPAYALMLAMFGLSADDTELPADGELIGFDQERGVFNFYSVEGGKWSYFGSSIDLLKGATTEGERRCAHCHTGGGLVMKELETPWVHWEGRATLPGVTEILEHHPVLESREHGKVSEFRPAGKELEDVIKAGNEAWAKTKVAHLRKDGTVRELLEPLFCTVELNLGAVAQSPTPPAGAGEIGLSLPARDLLIDPRLAPSEEIAVPAAEYHAAITLTKQKLVNSCDKQLLDKDGNPVTDTLFDLTYPHRAHLDAATVDALVAAQVIDDGFATAVLMVDFTRPIFSKARCDLLDRVPELPADQRSAEGIRGALVGALQKAKPKPGSPAAALLENLAGTTKARVASFLQACRARPTGELMLDVLRYVSLLRTKARDYPVIEFPEAMPVDALELDASSHLDPLTCRLTRESG